MSGLGGVVGRNWSDDNSSEKSDISLDGSSSIITSSICADEQTSHDPEGARYSHPDQNSEQTVRQLTTLFNNVLNSRGNYEILDNILRKRNLEIVVKVDPSDIISDNDLKTISLEEQAEARNFVIRVLSRQQQVYSERNFHHLDNLSLKRMIPDAISHWKKKSDPESVIISLPLPSVAPMITTPIRDRFLGTSTESMPHARPSPLNIDNCEMSLENYFDDSISTATAVSFPSSSSTSTRDAHRSPDIISDNNGTSSLRDKNPVRSEIRAGNGSGTSSESISTNDIVPNTTINARHINVQPSFISKPKPNLKPKSDSSSSHPTNQNMTHTQNPTHIGINNHGHSRKEQLDAFIGLCLPSTTIVNATLVYDTYCKWCVNCNYEKYTRPMFTKALRDKMGTYEIKSDTGRSKGWTINLSGAQV